MKYHQTRNLCALMAVLVLVSAPCFGCYPLQLFGTRIQTPQRLVLMFMDNDQGPRRAYMIANSIQKQLDSVGLKTTLYGAPKPWFGFDERLQDNSSTFEDGAFDLALSTYIPYNGGYLGYYGGTQWGNALREPDLACAFSSASNVMVGGMLPLTPC